MKVAAIPMGITAIIFSLGRNTPVLAGFIDKRRTAKTVRTRRRNTQPWHQAPPARDLDSSFALLYQLRINITAGSAATGPALEAAIDSAALRHEWNSCPSQTGASRSFSRALRLFGQRLPELYLVASRS